MGGKKIRNGDIASGDYLHANGAVIMSDRSLVFPESAIELTEETSDFYIERRKTRASRSISGSRSVLVVPAKFNDAETSVTDDQLYEAFFGTDEGKPSLKSQTEACSHNQVQIIPANGKSTSGVRVNDGVHRITIDSNVVGVELDDLEDIFWEYAMGYFGDLEQYDHVAFIFPYGSVCEGDDWGAYAYYDSYDMYFNNEKGKYISWIMHEIGHNYNLGHSGERKGEYNDYSSYMGASWDYRNWPKQCYNGPKMVQLSWVSDREVDLGSSTYEWSGDLYPMADYLKTTSSDKMVVYMQLNKEKKEYLYVTYNKATGANIDTYEGVDKVLVHTKKRNLYSWHYSYLVAKLSAGETYTHDDSISISFISKKSNGSARVVIEDENTSTDPCPSDENKEDEFYWKTVTKKGEKVHKSKSCAWLQERSRSRQRTYCEMEQGRGEWDPAKEVCVQTCCELEQ